MCPSRWLRFRRRSSRSSATANALPQRREADSNESPPDTDEHDEPLPKHPSLTINKVTVDGSKSGDGLYIKSGEAISWTYVVSNTGNVTLHNIVVRDSDFGVSGHHC